MPAITTITLAAGAQYMAKQKVIVKYLESIENFGSIDIFCSDKTGTLTTGETQLEGDLDVSDHPSDRVLLFGYLSSVYDTGMRVRSIKRSSGVEQWTSVAIARSTRYPSILNAATCRWSLRTRTSAC